MGENTIRQNSRAAKPAHGERPRPELLLADVNPPLAFHLRHKLVHELQNSFETRPVSFEEAFRLSEKVFVLFKIGNVLCNTGNVLSKTESFLNKTESVLSKTENFLGKKGAVLFKKGLISSNKEIGLGDR